MKPDASIQVYADGVTNEVDAARLWACGIDGATEPWISSLDILNG